MLVSRLQLDPRGARASRLAVGSGWICVGALGLELATVAAVSTLTGAAWHWLVYGTTGDVLAFLGVGALTGLLYTLPFAFRSEYSIESLLAEPRAAGRLLSIWTYAFFTLLALALLTKTTGIASRGWLGLFYLTGCIAVLAASRVVSRSVRALVASGAIAPRRLMVIGTPDDVSSYVARAAVSRGVDIVATAILPTSRQDAPPADAYPSADAILDAAVEKARHYDVHQVLILAAGMRSDPGLAGIADRFLDLPASIHIGNLPLTGRFPRLQADRVAGEPTLRLRAAPLDTWERALKRIVDLGAAMLGLVLLAPLLAIVALLIKLDSSGPVFFRQRRRGFNQREFLIWKFRTMTTLEDGPSIAQARANDPRVTRVGRVLRRWNLDELPQLLNVIRGEMSLVGPRPHAVAHDAHYERIIGRYQRRLNVKPGITGWAQINGYRGLTDTDQAMHQRISYDLYYIDNWSLALDAYILLMTVVSPKAFRNAL